jgi:hypothetical protein
MVQNLDRLGEAVPEANYSEAGTVDREMKTSDRATDSEDDILADTKTPIKAQDVLRKLDTFLLWKFFLLTVLCYLDR